MASHPKDPPPTRIKFNPEEELPSGGSSIRKPLTLVTLLNGKTAQVIIDNTDKVVSLVPGTELGPDGRYWYTKPKTQPVDTCQCGHGRCYHDQTGRNCGACACKTYVAPPVEPGGPFSIHMKDLVTGVPGTIVVGCERCGPELQEKIEQSLQTVRNQVEFLQHGKGTDKVIADLKAAKTNFKRENEKLSDMISDLTEQNQKLETEKRNFQQKLTPVQQEKLEKLAKLENGTDFYELNDQNIILMDRSLYLKHKNNLAKTEKMINWIVRIYLLWTALLISGSIWLLTTVNSHSLNGVVTIPVGRDGEIMVGAGAEMAGNYIIQGVGR